MWLWRHPRQRWVLLSGCPHHAYPHDDEKFVTFDQVRVCYLEHYCCYFQLDPPVCMVGFGNDSITTVKQWNEFLASPCWHVAGRRRWPEDCLLSIASIFTRLVLMTPACRCGVEKTWKYHFGYTFLTSFFLLESDGGALCRYAVAKTESSSRMFVIWVESLAQDFLETLYNSGKTKAVSYLLQLHQTELTLVVC